MYYQLMREEIHYLKWNGKINSRERIKIVFYNKRYIGVKNKNNQYNIVADSLGYRLKK